MNYKLYDGQILPSLNLTPIEKVAFDLETTGLDHFKDKVRLIQIKPSCSSPVIVIDTWQYPHDDVRHWITTELAQDERRLTFIGHNLMFDWLFVRHHYGVELFSCENPPFDTLLMGRVLARGDTTLPNTLRAVAHRYLGVEIDKSEQKRDWGVPELPQEAIEYAAYDVDYLHALREAILPLLLAPGDDSSGYTGREALTLLDTAQLEARLLPVLARASYHGILVDSSTMKEDGEAIAIKESEKLEKLNLVVYAKLGIVPYRDLFGTMYPPQIGGKAVHLNYNSPVQLLGLFREHVDAGIEATNAKTLSGYKKDPMVAAYLDWKTAATEVKDHVKYRESIVESPTRNRLHPQFKQMGAGTGRLSCKKPNVLNIPRALRLREAMVAPPGRVFVNADFPQIELRIAARIFDDKRMLQAFYDDIDIHTFTASIVLEKPIDEVTKADRQSAKATNFGLVYVQGARGFKEYARFGYGVDLTLEQAQDFKDKFLKTYRAIRRAQQEAVMLCRRYERTGKEVETITLGGRRRLLSGFAVTPQNIVNSPVQGTGVDMLERSIWLIDSRLRQVGLSSTAYLVNAVYDEVLIECNEENALEVAEITKSSMEQAAKFYLGDIPCSVDYGIGSSWKEAKP